MKLWMSSKIYYRKKLSSLTFLHIPTLCEISLLILALDKMLQVESNVASCAALKASWLEIGIIGHTCDKEVNLLDIQTCDAMFQACSNDDVSFVFICSELVNFTSRGDSWWFWCHGLSGEKHHAKCMGVTFHQNTLRIPPIAARKPTAEKKDAECCV